jgi:hypothetical protein
MRLSKIVAVAAVIAGLIAPQSAHASDPPPHPSTCLPKVEVAATPADPAGIVATGVVAVASAQIVCTWVHSNPLDHTVNQLVNWSGHITIYFQTSSGILLSCAHGPDRIPGVGPLLVLAAVQTCFIPVSDPARLNTLEVVVHWATLAPPGPGTPPDGYYVCCDSRVVQATPVGVV